MENDSNEAQAESGKKTHSTLTLPLPNRLVQLINDNTRDKKKTDEIIAKIEEKSRIIRQEFLYNAVCEVIGEYISDNPRKIAGLLFMYKKRKCLSGDKCLNPETCLFLHDFEQLEGQEMESDGNYQEKRRKQTILSQNKEIIFNKVPLELHDEALISAFASDFGPVESIRKLNEGKYLIKFNDYKSAQKIMMSTDPVMGNGAITKFYNSMQQNNNTNSNTSKAPDTLEGLFSEQTILIDQIGKVCSAKDLIYNLKQVNLRLRTLIGLPIKTYNNNDNINYSNYSNKTYKYNNTTTKTDNNTKMSSNNSLYANQFK